MRIAIDMQACQTESRNRGIGRYSLELARALLNAPRPADEYLLGCDRTLAEHIPALRDQLGPVMGNATTFGYTYPPPLLAHGSSDDAIRPAAAAIIRQQYSEYSPDLIHVSSLFEDAIGPIGGLGQLAKLPGSISSVTLYDLIPSVFPEQYLFNEERRFWHAAKVRELHQFDVILAISEATKADATRLLGIPEGRIAVVHAGVDKRFFTPSSQDPAALRRRYGIEGRFVLYTGNSDPRKNLGGAIVAFAAIPKERRAGVQLVMNQVGDERPVRAMAQKAGLSPRDLIITGRVDDADLHALLSNCDVFFFPSLYEGFGLPVLEAMACGAVAIAGNNSSLREVAVSEDMLFDATSIESATRSLMRALDDEGFRVQAREQGVARASEYTWERTARLTREAWEEARMRRDARKLVGGRRLNIALVTPLPPERTGIADYIAELLPALGERFVIDAYTTAEVAIGRSVPGVRSVRPWNELPDNADLYDQVIYQMGNSPFHAHMIELLDRVPGMVVLHDFFLSSMMLHVDRGIGQLPGLFSQELERSHGVGAVAKLDREGNTVAWQTYPCSRRLIERADAVLVHSQHAVDIARSFFPGLLRGPFVHAPMPLASRANIPEAERQKIRRELGISPTDILCTSFGFIAETKLNLDTLAAFADPRLSRNPNVKLVFVGDLGGGGYPEQIAAAIEAHPMRERIHITGFVTGEVYANYLKASDMAVQLRQLSRGETSKAVYDCMSNAVPVVVNKYASFAEIPDHAAPKVPAKPAPDDLVKVLHEWVQNPDARRRQGEAGHRYVETEHAPSLVAAAYRHAVELSIESRLERGGAALAKRLASALVPQPGGEPVELDPIREALEGIRIHTRPRIFVDVTELAVVDYGTGIHRVVRNVLRELALAEDGKYRCVPVIISPEGDTTPGEHMLSEKVGLRTALPFDPYLPGSADVLFLLDSNWMHPSRFDKPIAEMRAAGGQVMGMVYDLIPLRHPEHCVSHMPAVFEAWLRYMVGNCDALICISRAVADDLRAWIEESGIPHHGGLRIGHVWLGAEVAESLADQPAEPSPQVVAAMAEAERSVLMVGTVEPRKRHDVALDAFEKAWSEGSEQRLVIIGKRGWNVDALCARIERHEQFGKRLFWLQGISDVDLNYAYERASRVLQASDAEGFGLPLVEASHYGKPLLLSDIPVFREIAGNDADYFVPGDAQSLYRQLASTQAPTQGRAIATISWAECAAQLTGLMSGSPWDYHLP
jgi:glycosyltransferase involved in cell wall biosynthesis